MGWLRNLVDWLDPPRESAQTKTLPDVQSARNDARNRLKLVLMHDRTQLSPSLLEQMRDDMVDVISKYVEIDKNALELNLESMESGSNTVALVASIPVLRARPEVTAG
ncbi:MAG TPA: cell division topological specificity factor MinE [Oculatellaceae cyanobacterium]|jgi:cell division topological specificity factor